MQATSPQQALKMLENDANTQIIDIRSKQDVREGGIPNLRTTKKSLISVPYQPPQGPTPQTSSGTVSVGWAQRIARMKKARCLVLTVVCAPCRAHDCTQRRDRCIARSHPFAVGQNSCFCRRCLQHDQMHLYAGQRRG